MLNYSFILLDLKLITGFSLFILACLVVYFRDNIRLFVSNFVSPSFLHKGIWNDSNRIKKIDLKIEKIRSGNFLKTGLLQSLFGGNGIYFDGILRRYNRFKSYIGVNISSVSESDEFFDGLNNLSTGEKVDKLIQRGLEPDVFSTVSYKDLDIRSRIDRLILLDKIGIQGRLDNVFSELFNSNIDFKVDNLLFSKIQEKIDNF